jgi:UTP:GlnB (protein PII) uridylyltransferase
MDPKRKFDRNPANIHRFLKAMKDIVSGRLSPEPMLRDSTPLYRQDPMVHKVVPTRFAVIEITTHDRPDLLHQLTSAIAAQGYNIEIALIMTLGQNAIDSFHLSKC